MSSAFGPARGQSQESIKIDVCVSRLPSDLEMITNSEHVSRTDEHMKLCDPRMQNETSSNSNYDIMKINYYHVQQDHVLHMNGIRSIESGLKT